MANRLNLKLSEEAARHRKQGRPLGEAVLEYKGEVDTSTDTVKEEVLFEGYTAHNARGEAITGTYTNPYNADTTQDTVTEESLREGYTAHDANGKQITGKFRGGSTTIVYDTFAFTSARVVTNVIKSTMPAPKTIVTVEE